VGKADWLQHMNFVHDPQYFRLPVNRFEDAARGGWRHNVVTDALDLHFWAVE
jgi:hypothetical protein